MLKAASPWLVRLQELVGLLRCEAGPMEEVGSWGVPSKEGGVGTFASLPLFCAFRLS